MIITPIGTDTIRRLLAAIGPVPAPPSAPVDKEPFAHAVQAITELQAALFRAGIVLPSVAIDFPATASGCPLVRLGSARADIVRTLAVLITKGAERHDRPDA
ncbi:hypothetical protein [Streptomyces sp. NPDC003077]|uniref:hypothetical protein n=1 Tax=Streptomyces sp. NPDC003077 TaxID=3154443 RepID=UPI0033AC08B6